VKLNTSDFTWLVLAPGLYNAFPNQALELELVADPAPVASFSMAGASINVTGYMQVNVAFSNGTDYTAFTLAGTIYLTANATLIPGPNIRPELVYLHTDFDVQSTNVGNVSLSELNGMVDLLIKTLVPEVNQKLAGGFPIPTVDGISLVNPEVTFQDGYMLIATDLLYNPSSLLQSAKQARRR